jgi:lysophospholipase L1-like esterase
VRWSLLYLLVVLPVRAPAQDPSFPVSTPAQDPSSAVPTLTQNPSFAFPTAAQSPSFAAPTPTRDPLSFDLEVKKLELRLAGAPQKPIIFYGSSSIRLWSSLQKDFPTYPVVNCGFGGSRLTDCLRFAPNLVLRLHPAAVVIYAGDNDLAQGTSPEAALNSFEKLFSLLRSNDPSLPIAFISVKPSPARFLLLNRIERFNELVDEFLDNEPRTEFIDVYTSMLGPNRQPKPELFREDRLHLNAAGYAIVRREVGEFLSSQCRPQKFLLTEPQSVTSEH